MSGKCMMLLAALPLLAVLGADNETDAFVIRIKAEIEAARAQAASVRLATEEQWKAHGARIASLQNEADSLSGEIEAMTDEVEALRYEAQLASQKAASLKRTEAQLKALLNCDDAALAKRLQCTLDEKEALMRSLLATPGEGIDTDAVDGKGRIMRGTAYRFGPLALFSHGGRYAQLFDAAGLGLPKVPGEFHEKTPPLEITGRHPELLARENGIVMHLRKGGIIIVPILALGLLCLAIVLIKLWEFIANPMDSDMTRLEELAKSAASGGEKLEEQLFAAAQELVSVRQRMLFWLSVSASAAPLLGLLGTVTGMIHTFRLITLFGVGDARLLADGISEALVTTEAGLCVAIPALLCHAWLSRLLRRHSSNLEAAIARLCH